MPSLSSPPPHPPLSAAHLLSDVLAFLISLFAIWISRRPAAGSLTWGSHRYELVGAVLSVFLVWLLTVVLCIEAVDRILHPEPVNGLVMFVTALLGLLVNLAMMKILHQDLGGGGATPMAATPMAAGTPMAAMRTSMSLLPSFTWWGTWCSPLA